MQNPFKRFLKRDNSKQEQEVVKMATEKPKADAKPKPLKLDGDKGIYSREEVEILLKKAGVSFKVTVPDGKVEGEE